MQLVFSLLCIRVRRCETICNVSWEGRKTGQSLNLWSPPLMMPARLNTMVIRFLHKSETSERRSCPFSRCFENSFEAQRHFDQESDLFSLSLSLLPKISRPRTHAHTAIYSARKKKVSHKKQLIKFRLQQPRTSDLASLAKKCHRVKMICIFPLWLRVLL